MIQSIFHRFVRTPIDEVGDLVVEAQKHVHSVTAAVSDFVGHVRQAPDRVHDFFMDDYHPLMGAGFRFATLPLLLPTPLGPAAAAQAVLALAHLGSLAYDIYQYEEEIEDFFIDVKKRHRQRGSLGY